MSELLAPNGKPSNLTPKQYELVRTPAFKEWFGDWENSPETSSKVVGYNGEPLPVYHGTNTEPFVVFYEGSYFTDDYMNADGYASGEMVYEVFLNIKNPLIINARGRKWDNLKNKYGNSTGEIVGQLDMDKYDGVIFNNINDNWFDDEMGDSQNVYFTISPNQIKLADGMNTTFDGGNSDIRFNDGGETNLDNIELDFYVVRFDTDDNSEIELVTNDFEDAKYRYDSTSIGDYGDGSFGVSLEKFTNKYKLVYELDEDETIEDYPIEDYHEDSYYYKLINEGEHEVIENRFIESVNNSSNDLLNDVENWAKNKFGNYKYNVIPVYSENDKNEENSPIGSIQLRIANHSQNENNLPYGINRSLSVVIANKDVTRGRFQQNRPQIYFNGDDSFNDVIAEIENYIEEAKDYIRSKYNFGGEVGTGLFSQIWNWFGIKF